MNTKGLSRRDLKILAIIAMVVDHTAWGFVDFMSPLGQIMHIFGRLTIPIMCFFVAEGYRHTSDLKSYINRMASFAVVSIFPFYIFFHEEYDFRQNIIFDLLLALLALSIADNKVLPKGTKAVLIAGLMGISLAIGGWVLMPIIYVLVFYYGKDFKTKAKWFIIFTLIMEASLVVMILLNQKYHFSKYDWNVPERLYLLGFVFGLIPLYFYNGKLGEVKNTFNRYFFYTFYPAHFLVLSAIKYLVNDPNYQMIYITAHVIALVIAIIMLGYVISLNPSRAQNAVTCFMIFAIMYIFGFLQEITTSEVAGVYTATKLQFFAECMLFIALTYSMQELCHTRISGLIYSVEAVASFFVMYSLFTYEDNGLMYKAITINYDAGSFPRMQVVGYGIAFKIFVVYSFAVCLMCVIIGVKSARHANSLHKKRLRFLLYAMIVMWLPYLIKVLNLTNGYEIPVLGIPFAAIFVSISLGKYSYLDSISLDFGNALNKGKEGVVVVDTSHRILYHNKWVNTIFGEFYKYDDAYSVPGLKDIFVEKKKSIEIGGHTYETRIEPLIEQSHVTGQILWVLDLTEHYNYLNKVEETASKDSLTGVYNRGWFEENIKRILSEKKHGAFIMLDLDNFKNVNDKYGHKTGDAALVALASVMLAAEKSTMKYSIYSGRIGGDEFCMFIEGNADKKWLQDFAKKQISSYDEELAKIGCEGVTSISLGIVQLTDESYKDKDITYEELYTSADKALYMAKEHGKKTYEFKDI
ncbi:diguanylate cyclase (GGDEF) domain-containing protein [Butyrivibrio sp. INlla18]|uniref:TraX family protein n=1 Tax=Butyrivibrio sp. INlla18 TaxID=1520806 RepID=UPI0008900B09|nr:TraX family protein [Butyrivibrio sp. INlla18]SDA70377.1 diguanylate cyclase (GGDEF) domain-containing protein [Butyrivibrio sp. INlla18]